MFPMTVKGAQGFKISFQLVLELYCAHNVLGHCKERKYKEKFLSSTHFKYLHSSLFITNKKIFL